MEVSDATPLERLRCPAASCSTPMSPPIRLCPEGHSACRRHRRCPTCAAPLLPHLRHERLEALSRAVVAPCENRPRGCAVALGLDALQRHHAVCPRRLSPCPLAAPLCSGWRGSPQELPAHLTLQHRHRVLAPGRFSVATLLRDSAPHFLLLPQQQQQEQQPPHTEVFVLRHCLEDSRLRVALVYVGLQDNASNFHFTVQLTSSAGQGVYGAPVSADSRRDQEDSDGEEDDNKEWTVVVDGEEFTRIFADLDDSRVFFAVNVRRNKVVKDDPKRKKSTKW